MSSEIITEAAPAPRAVEMKDLSKAIERSIGRESGEEVRIVRVFEDRYRCNWWTRDTTPGPTYFNTGRIVRSKFLKASMSGEELVIEDLSSTSLPK